MPLDPATYRYRLPRGYSHLKPDIGRIVKELREAMPMKQESLAHDVGISRAPCRGLRTAPHCPVLERLSA